MHDRLGRLRLRGAKDELGLAPSESPALTGTPTAPTTAISDSSTKLATTAYVQAAIGAPVGGSVLIAPDFARYRWAWELANHSGASFEKSASFPGMTTSGSSGPTQANDSDGIWISIGTAATSGNGMNRRTTNFNEFRRDHGLLMGGVFKTGPSVAALRMWLGLGTAAMGGSSDPAGVHLAAFRYDTGVPDSFIQCCAKDGTTLNAQATSQGLSANTVYNWWLDMSDSSKIDFYINESLVGSLSSNLPTATQVMGGFGHIFATLENVSKSFLHGRLWYRQK
jgi:hypothetical protein